MEQALNGRELALTETNTISHGLAAQLGLLSANRLYSPAPTANILAGFSGATHCSLPPTSIRSSVGWDLARLCGGSDRPVRNVVGRFKRMVDLAGRLAASYRPRCARAPWGRVRFDRCGAAQRSWFRRPISRTHGSDGLDASCPAIPLGGIVWIDER